jgi:hypothetical protein
MIRVLAVTAILVVPPQVRAGATLLGAGSQPCSAWTNRTKSTVIKGAFESWVVGFISALNISGDRELVGGGDFTSIVAWMDRRCKSTPSAQIGVATLDLAVELAGSAARRP